MSVMEEDRARTWRSFSDEFKRDAVAMVLDDGNKIVDVADRLGVGEGTLGNWVRQS
jgi:transposase